MQINRPFSLSQAPNRKSVLVITCLRGFANSRSCARKTSDRQAKEFITEDVAPHVRAIGVISSITDSYIPNTSIKTHEVSLSNSSRIIALPANPDTARSYEGDVTLDEFGFHIDARRIYEAIEPSITRGYALKIISTPNGQPGAYYDLAKMVGLVDGHRSTDIWSTHKTGLLQAIAQGCRERAGSD